MSSEQRIVPLFLCLPPEFPVPAHFLAPRLIAVLLAAAAVATPFALAGPQPTELTYQGELVLDGAPVSSAHDVRYRLYSAATGGAQIGPELARPSTPITNGKFTSTLNFGPVFDGNERWIEIDVRPAGSTSYTTLSPRQKLAATPYALYALNTIPGPQGPAGPQGQPGSSAMFGDGSAGALVIAVDTDWSTLNAFNTQYSSIHLLDRVQWTIPSGVVLRCTGNVIIEGAITISPGAFSGRSVSPHPGMSLSPATMLSGGIGRNALQAMHLPAQLAFGGGAGAEPNSDVTNTNSGAGGGSFAILANGSVSLTVNGRIDANGVTAASPSLIGPGGGGGAGGIITLLSKTSITNNGLIRANGANGRAGFTPGINTSYGGGGGGSGGIVRIFAPTSDLLSGIVQANGGNFGISFGNSVQTQVPGGGGGACGGNGGLGGSGSAAVGTQPTAGSPGKIIRIETANPENLFH